MILCPTSHLIGSNKEVQAKLRQARIQAPIRFDPFENVDLFLSTKFSCFVLTMPIRLYDEQNAMLDYIAWRTKIGTDDKEDADCATKEEMHDGQKNAMNRVIKSCHIIGFILTDWLNSQMFPLHI